MASIVNGNVVQLRTVMCMHCRYVLADQQTLAQPDCRASLMHMSQK